MLEILFREIVRQLHNIWCGLKDAFRLNVVISTVLNDSQLRRIVLKSTILNSLCLAFIYALDLLLLPLVQHQQKLGSRWLYQALWLFPVMSVAFYLNILWSSAIARRTYILKHGSNASALLSNSSGTNLGILNLLASSSYRAVMISTCLATSFFLSYVPCIGPPVSFVFLCWIDAYYCFEFVWLAKGMDLAKRAQHIEERWCYYLAFGLPVTTLCSWGTTFASAASFALVFPAYIILAMHANPMPLDPYSHLLSDRTDLYHESLIPIRLPIFSTILWLTDKIISVDHVWTRQSHLSEDVVFAEEGTQTGMREPINAVQVRIRGKLE